jgi:GH3 auxin-responsive promoter
MKYLINGWLIKPYLMWRMRRINDYMRYPQKYQDAWLQKILSSAANTEIGKQYRFSELKSHEQYQSRLPIIEYDAAKDSIHRMMLGQPNVLRPGTVNWYSKSSGTTSDKSKFIPVPYENLFRCHIRGSWDSLALLYDNKPDMQIFRHKNLLLPGSFESMPERAETRYGDVSAVLTHHMPAIGRMFYMPDFETALQKNFEEKIEKTAEIISKIDDLVMFGGVPTWLIVLFRMVLEKTGKNNLLEIWPHLQAYMHGGVGFSPYRETFKELIPSDKFVYQEIYNASEGYFGAQCNLKQDGILLFMDNGMFFEFVPMEDWEKEHQRALTVSEVEIGKNYAILITTNGGLYRYAPGDTVVFLSKEPPTIRISGRTRQFINAFGEEVMVGDADKALSLTCESFHCIVAEYTAGPIYFGSGKKGGHQWVIEFEKPPADMQGFNRQLDINVQKVNSDYEAKRYKSMALNQLKLNTVPVGTFHAWLRAKGKMGSQSKVPRLANHRKYVEEILHFAETGNGIV